MTVEQTNVAVLVEEYVTFVQEASVRRIPHPESESDASLRETLIANGDWTPGAADALIELARGYGIFMLRNALALAVALDIEDGSLGY